MQAVSSAECLHSVPHARMISYSPLFSADIVTEAIAIIQKISVLTDSYI